MNGASLFRRDGNAGGFIDRVVNRTLNAWDSAYHNASLQAYSSNPWAVMGTMGMNALQTGLEVASYVPVLGAPASLANAYLHGIRGNYNAAKRELYAGGTGMLLGGGMGATFTRTAVRTTSRQVVSNTMARTTAAPAKRLGRDLTLPTPNAAASKLPDLPSGYHYRNVGGQNQVVRNPGQAGKLPQLQSEPTGQPIASVPTC